VSAWCLFVSEIRVLIFSLFLLVLRPCLCWVAFHLGLSDFAVWRVEVVWVSFYVFVVWGVVPSDDAFVLFYDCVAVFLKSGVIIDV